MKQFICKLLTLCIMFCLMAVFAQETDARTSEIKVHDYESLRALEFDSELAERKDAEGLRAYLTGNILIGVWDKANTRQYFAPSGSTWYQEGENAQSHGTWRVRDDGKYCSVWPPSRHESCYEVSFIDEVLFWHNGRNRYPSTIQVIIKDEPEKDDTETDDNGDSS